MGLFSSKSAEDASDGLAKKIEQLVEDELAKANKALEGEFKKVEDAAESELEKVEQEAGLTGTTGGGSNPEPQPKPEPKPKPTPKPAPPSRAQPPILPPRSALSEYRGMQYPQLQQDYQAGQTAQAAADQAFYKRTASADEGGEVQPHASPQEHAPPVAMNLAAAAPAPPTPAGPYTPPPSTFQGEDTRGAQFNNAEAAAYAPTMVVTPTDEMIGQAAGLAAQASAQYFDSMTKMVMASQSVLLKKLTQDVVEGDVVPALEDGVAIVGTELLLAGAMAVAAAGGAMEAKSAAWSIQQINESLKNAKLSGAGGGQE